MVWGAKAGESRILSGQRDADASASSRCAVAVAAVCRNLAVAGDRTGRYIDCSARGSRKIFQIPTKSIRFNIAIDRERTANRKDNKPRTGITLLIAIASTGGTPVKWIKD